MFYSGVEQFRGYAWRVDQCNRPFWGHRAAYGALKRRNTFYKGFMYLHSIYLGCSDLCVCIIYIYILYV